MASCLWLSVVLVSKGDLQMMSLPLSCIVPSRVSLLVPSLPLLVSCVELPKVLLLLMPPGSYAMSLSLPLLSALSW